MQWAAWIEAFFDPQDESAHQKSYAEGRISACAEKAETKNDAAVHRAAKTGWFIRRCARIFRKMHETW